MDFLTLFNREIKQIPLKLLIAIILSGLFNMLLVEVLSEAAANVEDAQAVKNYFIFFLLCGGITFYSKDYIFKESFIIIEGVVYSIRQRIAQKVQQTELSNFEAIGTSPLYARLSRDVQYISDSGWYILHFEPPIGFLT